MAKRNDNKAEAMYAFYLKGNSLRKVARRFGMGAQGVHKIFQTRKYALRPRRGGLPFVMFNGEKYSLRSNGYYASTTRRRGLLHRDVWRHFRGPIPPDYQIHHKDENKGNNDIDNLELMHIVEHANLHLLTCPNCGFKHGGKKTKT